MTPNPEVRPSSPLQEALWWIQHRGGRKDLMNLTWRLRTGRLDPAVLESAWRHVVDRHEALRSGFARHGESVVRIVHPAPFDARPQHIVWERAPEDRSAQALLDEVAAGLHAIPFVLDDAPLARLALVRVGAVDELVVTAHHAVVDGWGMQLLLDDLHRCYVAVRDGGVAALSREAVVPAPAEEGPRADPTAAETGFWTDRLRGARPAALMPEPSGAAPGSGAVLRHTLSPRSRAAVATIGRRVGCTEFAVHLAAVRTVLARGGASGRTALGTVVANRPTLADQRRVDYRANTVLLADEIGARDTFDAVVTRARDSLWESLPFQHVTYPEVFARLTDEDRATLGTVPPVLVTHHGGIGSGIVLGDEPARLLPSPSTSARCQLLVGVFDDGADTVLEVEYDTCALTGRSVRVFLADVEAVLSASAAEGRLVADLQVSTRATADRARPADGPHADAIAEPAESDGVLADWHCVFGRVVRPHDDFFALGGHSLQVLELVACVEKNTGAELDLEAWLEEPTPARMERLLSPAGQDTPAPAPAAPVLARTVVLRAGAPGGRHLHLVHGAGVGVLPYRELAGALPGDWRVTVSEDDGAAGASIEDMAAHYTARLLADGLPDLLGGWSMGGLLAHEIAAGLRAQGHPCPPLLLLDAPVPGDAPEEGTDAFARAVLRGAATVLSGPDRLGLGPRDDQALDTLAVLLRITSDDAVGDALHARHALHRRHTTAMTAPRASRTVDVPALVVAADLADGDLDRWRGFLTGDTRSARIPAGHYELLTRPAVDEVARLAVELMSAHAAAR
ncbi:condensation domain-containing protein [Streptomyces sp. NPDC046716]|uniref:condensation domain-containing protein n=1 Tax=Streptomyces sp. NPDC046716 TaxID=3157093 RepID=UPI0033D60614